MKLFYGILVFLLLAVATTVPGDVVINEFNYDPVDDTNNPGTNKEFIELYNPGTTAIDLTGYVFTSGITFTFPQGSTINAAEYVVLAKLPSSSIWRSKTYKIFGPYDGKLSNSGESLKLERPDGTTVEKFKYQDAFPWPQGADGYGYSAERIAWDLPTNDSHSWRTSTREGGTPGAANTCIGVIPRPVMIGHDTVPKHPTSKDDVTVQVGLDSPSVIESVLLKIERATAQTQQNQLVKASDTWKYFKGTAAPSANIDWTSTGFNDSSWLSGPGGIGYGSDAYEQELVKTQLPDMKGSYSSVYIRKTFQVADPATLGTLSLTINVDDGFVCYINGKEIVRFGVPQDYTFSQISEISHESSEALIYELGPASAFLQKGDNVIAIVGVNITLGNSTDFVLSPNLVTTTQIGGNSNLLPMTISASNLDAVTYEAKVSPTASQTLVRYNVEVKLKDGNTLILPYNGDIRPYESYFVYDGEIESTLPIMWLFDDKISSLPQTPRKFSAAVCVYPPATPPQVFDGLNFERSGNGNKIKFLKGEEFRGDRTLNVNPESPTDGGNAGETGPSREYLGFWFFHNNGVPSPRADWYRFIENPGTTSEIQTTRLLVQQPNERFLEMNGLDTNGDLYKLEWNIGYVKHTNLDEPTTNMDQFRAALKTNDMTKLKNALYANADVDEYLRYAVTSVLQSNWDGFFNNQWWYIPTTDTNPEPKWIIIPWDTDKCWGYTDSYFQFYKMPVDYPLNGQAEQASRSPGEITGAFHKVPDIQAEYKIRLRKELDAQFADNSSLFKEIARIEKVLQDDLNLQEAYTGKSAEKMRKQTTFSWDTIREFIQLRRGYLGENLPKPAPVPDWTLY